MSFATLDQLKDYLRIPSDDTEDDAVLSLALGAAETAIKRSTGRSFESPTGAERAFTAKKIADPTPYATGPLTLYRYSVEIDDTFTAAASVSVSYDPLGQGDFTADVAAGSFRMMPFNAPSLGKPYTSILFNRSITLPLDAGSVGVTADWGWSAVPDTIVTATLLQAARYSKRRDAPFGVAGSPEVGNALRLLAKLDPDVAVMVHDFKRYWGAV